MNPLNTYIRGPHWANLRHQIASSVAQIKTPAVASASENAAQAALNQKPIVPNPEPKTQREREADLMLALINGDLSPTELERICASE